ncbi:MAG: IS30 family transposase [Oscillospiraceae bacterium]|nr:IS30 family transposase [Oscillospiraceae bacterium]
MARKQHYMTRDERQQLEAMHRNRIPIAEIARQLGFCRQTIYNELCRGKVNYIRNRHGIPIDTVEYSAEKAQQKFQYAQTAKGRPLKIGGDYAYAAFLEQKIIEERYSPAAALAAARKQGYQTKVCVTTLYSYITKQVFYKLTDKHLWNKKKRKRKASEERRIAHPLLPSIINRPKQIEARSERGHWEMDLVVGKAKTKTVLLTLTERVTRQELIFKLPDRKAATVQGVFNKLEQEQADFKERFKSITTDNGVEFLQYQQLRQSIHGGQRFEVWYCHSYAAWEKGTNENHNRMIRRWFPKGTDFGKVPDEEIARVQDWMNHYPRKILNWATPAELAT